MPRWDKSRLSSVVRFCAALGLSIGTAACGGQAVDCFGSVCLPAPFSPAADDAPVAGVGEPPPTKSCSAPSNDVIDQASLERLRGCTDIEGHLTILQFDGIDLSPLSALRRVAGALTLVDRNSQFSPFGNQAVALNPLGLSDLRGLESLERVERLTVAGLGLSDLSPLVSLDVGERLSISACPSLQEFGAAISLGSNGQLLLSALPLLRSLKGLTLSAEMNSLQLSELPALQSLQVGGELKSLGRGFLSDLPRARDLAFFQELEEADSLDLRRLALRDLSDLGRLERVESMTLADLPLTRVQSLRGVSFTGLTLAELPQLTSLEGLSPGPSTSLLISSTGVRSLAPIELCIANLQSFQLTGNDQLTNVTALRSATSLIALTISDNAALQTLPDMPGVNEALASFDLFSNPVLLAGPEFSGLTVAPGATYRIRDNARLASFRGLRTLTEVALLEITGNPTLSDLNLSGLTKVGVLDISCNPSLPQASVEAVAAATGERTDRLIGNLGSSEPCEQ